VPSAADREGVALYVALYENGLSNRVTSGENRNATLSHDYVAREWWSLAAPDAAGNYVIERPLKVPANGGVAAFVQSRRTGEVLQALALPAC
jgi:hypothetical protein